MLKSMLSLASPQGHHGRLSVLIFHRVLAAPDPLLPDEPDVVRFDVLMRWVSRWFNVLPLDQAVAALRAGTLPPRAASITFDDGYANGYQLALPILQRYQLSATFFVATANLDGGLMWNDRLIEAVRHASGPWLDTGVEGIGTVRVGSLEEKRALLTPLLQTVALLPLPERSEIVTRLVAVSGVVLPQEMMFNATQVRAMRAADMLIGAHTVNHPCLRACADDEAEFEIREGRARLEAIIDEPVKLFAYPYGKPGKDYDNRHVAMVKKLGFEAAFSTCWGSNSASADACQLMRFTPWDRNRWRFGLRMLGNLFK
ncbi:polysaccharide deacetylase [Betaproteobacteria bacterium]|nr:polysaccharide deacetylase [Betaproteobacteria bacterium]GHU22923.1 polysaccharide deacetylase [Betaproteobacteria bacterium]GHU27474.1 polysaccharide deacetylase [Betaproteobacteria bacterium]